MKIQKVKMRIKFLEKCHCYRLIPIFLRFKIPTNGAFKEEAVTNFQRRLLKLEQLNARKHAGLLNEKLTTYRAKVQTEIPEILWSSSQVIYEIECPKCLDCYVGMTFRHLCTRVSEHFKRGGTMNRHIEDCGLNFDPMTNTTILDSTNRASSIRDENDLTLSSILLDSLMILQSNSATCCKKLASFSAFIFLFM